MWGNFTLQYLPDILKEEWDYHLGERKRVILLNVKGKFAWLIRGKNGWILYILNLENSVFTRDYHRVIGTVLYKGWLSYRKLIALLTEIITYVYENLERNKVTDFQYTHLEKLHQKLVKEQKQYRKKARKHKKRKYTKTIAALPGSDTMHGGDNASDDKAGYENTSPDTQNSNSPGGNGGDSLTGLTKTIAKLVLQNWMAKRTERIEHFEMFLAKQLRTPRSLQIGGMPVITTVRTRNEPPREERAVADALISLMSKFTSGKYTMEDFVTKAFDPVEVVKRLELGLDVAPAFEARTILDEDDTTRLLILSPDYSGSTQDFSVDIGTAAKFAAKRLQTLGYEVVVLANSNGVFKEWIEVITGTPRALKEINRRLKTYGLRGILQKDDFLIYMGDYDCAYNYRHWAPEYAIILSIYSSSIRNPYLQKKMSKLPHRIWIDGVSMNNGEIAPALQLARKYL